MKRKLLLVCCVIAALSFSACGSKSETKPAEIAPAKTSTENQKTVVDLKGEWSQVNDSDGMKHVATITDSSIEIYWLDEEDETKSLYWCGSFVPPEENSKKYEWESVNDKEKTGSALLASSDETKKFTYENGQIIYDASALGVTKTVRLEKKNQ